jgi:hypothetical protein
MMRLPVYQNLHVESRLKSADQRSELEALLQLLLRTDEAYAYIYIYIYIYASAFRLNDAF